MFLGTRKIGDDKESDFETLLGFHKETTYNSQKNLEALASDGDFKNIKWFCFTSYGERIYLFKKTDIITTYLTEHLFF